MSRYLIAEKTFSRIDIYEQRSTVGGVWNYTPENDAQRQYTVPQTEPGQPLDKPIWRRSRNSDTIPTERATFISPMYERLEANLPKQLMQHSDFPFPDGDQLFPTHASISKYLERYAESVTPLIRFGQQVVSVWKEEEAWQLRSVNLASQATTFENYDALIVASGHYNIPFIPERPGLQSWAAQYPDAISHSKFYRKPEDYRDKVCAMHTSIPYAAVDHMIESPHSRTWSLWRRHCISDCTIFSLTHPRVYQSWCFRYS